MNLRRLIGRLLAVFVIVGLVFAPLVTPAAAKRLAAAEMTDMAALSGDMPCCPDGQKSNNCQDCPLVAMCMLTIAQAEPSSTNAIQVSFQTRRLSFALDDLIADGLMGSPLDHPPRISI
ncbi:hypothetical protein [Bradyrhizobium sp. 2TAF24]|uniref:hypothetical protein n=1 Tax=Bradyrhizobium sp. 2TAF24 TaxID=3233011 RepID=UPI003F8FD93B